MARTLSENKMALFNIASTVVIAGINFITIPIFTRILDTSGFGVVNVYVAWVQIFTIFVGLKADGSIGSAKANLPEEEQDSYHLSILVMALGVFAVLFTIVIFALYPLSELLGMSPALTVCMIVQSFGAFVIALFNMRFIFRKQAQKNFLVSVGLCVATTSLSIVLIIYGFAGGEGYLGRIYGLAIPNVLLGAGLFISLVCSRKGRVRPKYWKFCLVLTLPLIFHGLSQLLLAQTGKIAIQQYYGDSLAGIFSIAVTIVSLMHAIYSALNNAFVPFMYDDLAGKTCEETKQRHFKNYMMLFTLGTCAFAMLSPELLKLMSTAAFWDATNVLPLLIIGQYCVFLYSFPVNYEFYKMKTKSIAFGTVMAAALNILLAVMLIPRLGMIGAALASTIAYLSLFVFHFLIARFVLGDRNYPAKAYYSCLIAVSIVCLAYYPLESLVFVRWAIGIVALSVVIVRMIKKRTIF